MGNGPSFHVFPRDPGKDAVRGPQNCQRNSSEAKSSKVFVFLRSEDCIFPQRSRGQMWNLIIIPWLCRFPNRGVVIKVTSLYSLYSLEEVWKLLKFSIFSRETILELFFSIWCEKSPIPTYELVKQVRMCEWSFTSRPSPLSLEFILIFLEFPIHSCIYCLFSTLNTPLVYFM